MTDLHDGLLRAGFTGCNARLIQVVSALKRLDFCVLEDLCGADRCRITLALYSVCISLCLLVSCRLHDIPELDGIWEEDIAFINNVILRMVQLVCFPPPRSFQHVLLRRTARRISALGARRNFLKLTPRPWRLQTSTTTEATLGTWVRRRPSAT